MDKRALIRYVLSPWVILGALGVGVVLTGVFLVAIWITRPGPGQALEPTALLEIIPMPSFTPTNLAPTPAPAVTPTGAIPSAPSDIATGAFVQVTGTGGDGLRMRSSPSLDGDVQFLGVEAEVFRVEDGPRQADGYTWWFLVAPYDPTVRGWAVANYLQVVQQP